MDDNIYVRELRQNNADFLFRRMPQLIEIDAGIVRIRSDSNELVKTDKFIATSYDRSWALEAGYAEISKFSSRAEFDETVIPTKERIGTFSTFYGKTSFKNVLEHLESELSINLDHTEFKNSNNSKENEDNLFNQELINLYGESQDDEVDLKSNRKKLMLIDFRMLSNCGKFLIATAKRANDYLFFCYSR